MTEPHHPRVTPEGHTPEEPAASELGKRGTPGEGMAPEVPHAADARDAEESGAHADAHAVAGDDEHGHAEPRIGPIDWPAWGFAAVGAAVGLLVVAMFYVATL